MKISPRIAAAAIGVLAIAGAGAGTAAAASQSTVARVAQVSAEPTSPDTDNIQSGDQTGLDPAGTAATVATHHQKAQTGGENGGESNESSGESSAPSDGPGGHADPSGNVQHEFSGAE
jgi:hypothetical protein